MKILVRTALTLALLTGSALQAQKLQVYILVGQSNMQGHAKISTFDYIGKDPATAPLLAKMRNEKGEPIVRDDVWISYLTGGRGGEATVSGPLTAGFGARRNANKSDDKIGPEFTFGIRVGDAHKQPVLLIKTAWGGKSLHTDFRSPSAGAYEFSEQQIATFKKRGKDIDEARAAKAKATGHYYRAMIAHVRKVLANPASVYPKYNAKAGYELGGIVWFQGWNDMVDRGTYPNRDKPGGYKKYSETMAHFIRDVRKDLNAPKLPFVIGVMGVGGKVAENDRRRAVHKQFRAGMTAPSLLEEFQGNVLAVPTDPYWATELAELADRQGKVRNMGRMLRKKNKKHANADGSMTPKQQREYLKNYRAGLFTPEEEAKLRSGTSNAAYHYLGCAKTMAGIGVGFADAVLKLRK